MRVVLDSNVWLDWLVFDDADIGPLKSACSAGAVQIFIDAACFDELAAILAHPEFALDAQRRLHLLTEVRRLVRWQESRVDASTTTLPRCADADDQKFIELASTASAEWLITRDKALIKLNRRLLRLGICVGTPAQWTAASAVTA